MLVLCDSITLHIRFSISRVSDVSAIFPLFGANATCLVVSSRIELQRKSVVVGL